MELKTKQMIHGAILAGIVFLIVGFCFVQLNNYLEPDPDKWCEKNMPQFNTSEENVRYCFSGGWDKYCKISYPEYC